MEIVKTKTRAEVDALARELLAERLNTQAPPKVRNATALAALGEHRAVKWLDHYYYVPPVPFKDAVRLLVVGNVLDGEDDPVALEVAARVARRVFPSVMFRYRASVSKHARVRTAARLASRAHRNPFRTMTPKDVRDTIRQLLHVQDETPPTLGKSASVVDLTSVYAEFCAAYPALVNRDGFPLSWEVYQVGVRNLPRFRARDQLDTAQASRMAQDASKDGYRNWEDDMMSKAGWK